MGDVVAIYESHGSLVAEYQYDAWGKVTVTNYNIQTDVLHEQIGTINPIRYRSYYYDVETKLYYLETRYYDPHLGRFLNPDSLAYLGDGEDLNNYNLFAYCGNNPVMYSDPTGHGILAAIGVMLFGAVVGAVVSALCSIIVQLAFTKEVNWASVGISAVSGFIGGAIAASPLSCLWQTALGGILGGATYFADCYVNNTEVTAAGLLLSLTGGCFAGYLGGDGVNYKLQLSNLIDDSNQAIARELRRANQDYANKAIQSILLYRNSTLINSAWSSGIRYSLLTGASSYTNAFYNKYINFDIYTWNLG